MSLKDNMDTRIEELLPFYALDALTEEEKKEVESYLGEHPEARLQLQELQAGASALPHSVAPVEPPPHVKEALMRRVTSDVQARERSSARATASISAAREPVRRGIH